MVYEHTFDPCSERQNKIKEQKSLLLFYFDETCRGASAKKTKFLQHTTFIRIMTENKLVCHMVGARASERVYV
jgi:hypothetical protein